MVKYALFPVADILFFSAALIAYIFAREKK